MVGGVRYRFVLCFGLCFGLCGEWVCIVNTLMWGTTYCGVVDRGCWNWREEWFVCRVLWVAPYTWAEKFESFERINSLCERNENFDSCNSCKRLGTNRLHELHESKFPFVSRIELICSKLSNFPAHVYGVSVTSTSEARGVWQSFTINLVTEKGVVYYCRILQGNCPDNMEMNGHFSSSLTTSDVCR